MSARKPENWLDALLPLPRPEYAKQTEALLTDLLWRSSGSNLRKDGLMESLAHLGAGKSGSLPVDSSRMVPRRRPGGSARLLETFPLVSGMDMSKSIAVGMGGEKLISALLESILAPRARGDKSEACVPIHPSLVSLQTLHGLVNKENPANLANAIENMGWLGGSPFQGSVAATFLRRFQNPSSMRDGATGAVENLSAEIAKCVWQSLPALPHWQAPPGWPAWPLVLPVESDVTLKASLSHYQRTPFAWFWKKWQRLTDPTSKWHEVLPARRYVDWAMCLLRSGLAFAYLWEAEFFTRLHDRIANRNLHPNFSSGINRVRGMLESGAVLAVFEPPRVPTSQKGIWKATSDLLARGYEARSRLYEYLDDSTTIPEGATFADTIENWIRALPTSHVDLLDRPIKVLPRTANNQKEFVRYLVLPRSSDDDVLDQADFYYLARSKSPHTWFHPGPEWMVVMTSLLCDAPGGECTLGALLDELASLGIRVDRSVLVGLLEQSGLSTDSPDADNALVIRSGF